MLGARARTEDGVQKMGFNTQDEKILVIKVYNYRIDTEDIQNTRVYMSLYINIAQWLVR